MAVPQEDKKQKLLLESHQRIREAQSNIQEMNRSTLETESMAFSVLQDLHSQREVISRTQGHINQIDDSTSGARRILTIMQRRAFVKKAAIGVMVFLLAVVLIAMIYYSFIKR
eukprot:TRINITY_DN6705_c0_g1_i1.p1 TRINITY_DN6705_c0_g1~~TRINITY_DN6705_c0_g1_i1.p1  ORF type:complete len:113 (+),score=34.79 TRINITY_DN6705_c0_g1_i1:107-445(+)